MAAQVEVTPDDHGPILAIVTWFMMVVLIVAVLMRLTIRIAKTRSLASDDWVIALTMVFGIVQSVAVSVGIQDGLGKKETLLNSTQISAVLKSQYASDLLYLIGLTLAKVSVLQLLHRLTVVKRHRLWTKVVGGIVLVWGLTAFLARAFQCSFPHTWDQRSKCFHILNYWIAIAPVDVLTEVYLIMFPFLMMGSVQVPTSKKAVVVAAFFWRILVIPATIARLFYIHNGSADLTFSTVNAGIATQVVLGVSIFTTCIPTMKPFLDSAESGALGLDMRHQGPGAYSSGSYKMNELSYAGKGSRVTRSQVGGPPHMGYKVGVMATDRDKRSVQVTEHRLRDRASQGKNEIEFGVDSISSHSRGSDEMIIKRTDQWTVHYEPADTVPDNQTGALSGQGNTRTRTGSVERGSELRSTGSLGSDSRELDADVQRNARTYV